MAQDRAKPASSRYIVTGPGVCNEVTRDRGAERSLLAALYQPTRRFAAVVGRDDVEPDDLVQEAYVRLLRRGLDGVRDPRAYLRRTVLNLASNEQRRVRSTERMLRRVGAPEVQRESYPSDLGELSTLTPATRALLYLTEIEGAPIAEAAEELGLTHTAARMRLSRERRQLRASVEEHSNERLA
jgi:RNA polymerase sigma factor (sigma-70 family)